MSNNCNENVNITDAIKVLGIEIDKDLTFDTHIAKLCSKTAAELNAVSRLNCNLGNSENSYLQLLLTSLAFLLYNSVKRNRKIPRTVS